MQFAILDILQILMAHYWYLAAPYREELLTSLWEELGQRRKTLVFLWMGMQVAL